MIPVLKKFIIYLQDTEQINERYKIKYNTGKKYPVNGTEHCHQPQ